MTHKDLKQTGIIKTYIFLIGYGWLFFTLIIHGLNLKYKWFDFFDYALPLSALSFLLLRLHGKMKKEDIYHDMMNIITSIVGGFTFTGLLTNLLVGV